MSTGCGWRDVNHSVLSPAYGGPAAPLCLSVHTSGKNTRDKNPATPPWEMGVAPQQFGLHQERSWGATLSIVKLFWDSGFLGNLATFMLVVDNI